MDGDGDSEDDEVVNDPSHVNTVKDKMAGFTQRQIKSAVIAQRFHNSPSLTTTSLLAVTDIKMLDNSPITREYVRHALSIWGPSVPKL